MATKIVNLKIDHIAGVDRPANKRGFLIIKQEKPVEDKSEVKGATMLTKEQIAKISDKDTQEAAVKQQEEMVALEKKNKELEESVAKGGPTTTTNENDEEIWKGVPPAIRNRFEAIKNERDEMEKKAKDERDQRETEHWVTKSKKFKYLQLTPEHFGKIMKAVAEHCPTEAQEIDRILERADDVIGKGAIFSELGKSNNGSKVGDATNVADRVEALADDFMKLDSKLSKSAAIEKVFKDHPEWHDPYRRESMVRV